MHIVLHNHVDIIWPLCWQKSVTNKSIVYQKPSAVRKFETKKKCKSNSHQKDIFTYYYVTILV